MKKIEKAIHCKMIYTINNYCPSDYGMENKEYCTFKETGIIDENECFHCWFCEVKKDD